VKFTGTPAAIIAHVLRDAPNTMAPSVARSCRDLIAPHKAQLLEWQGAVLYALAKPYDRFNANVLEIGTAAGYSAAILAHACPHSHIVSLNPSIPEMRIAAKHLRSYTNVTLLRAVSWDMLGVWCSPELDVVWVDGDHLRAAADLPWFNRLRPNGLLLFHDLSEEQCPPVWKAAHELGERIGRDLDVQVIDDQGIGMGGFRRREGERW